MIITKTVSYAALLLGLTVSLMYFSCDIKSPTEGVRVLLNEDPLTLVTVEVIDARTNQQIVGNFNDSVHITIMGPDKNAITDVTETLRTSFTSKSGFFTFAVSKKYPFPRENPLTVTIVADSEGYIASSMSIKISATGETFILALVQHDNPPEGVTTKTDSEGTANVNGQVTEAIVVKTDPDPVTITETSLNISPGTVIKDETGNILKGKLKTDITHFNNKSEESLNAFPSGLFTSITKSNESKDVVFVPAGFISVEITDETGNKAKTFDKPVEVFMQIPGDTVNPDTKTLVKNGDSIPIWYYEEENASWIYETDGIAIGPDFNENFEVQFSVTHFSYWTGGWEDDVSELCENGLTIRVVGGFTAVDVKIKKLSDKTYFSSLGKNVLSSDPFVRLPKSPRNTPVIIEAWYGSDLVGDVTVSDLCGADIELPVVIPGKAVTFVVEVYDVDNPEERMRPNRGIYVEENGSKKYIGYMVDGIITVYGLTEGIEYNFCVFYKDEWYSGTHLVDKRTYVEYEIPVRP